MSLSLFNAIPSGAIEVQNDEEDRPWFKRAHVGKYLGIKHIDTSLGNLDKREQRTRSEFKMQPVIQGSYPAFQDTDKFLSVYGVMHVIVNSKKSKGKALRDWIFRDIIPRGFNKLIEEKDTQLALLNDDLTIAEQNVVALEQDNFELQAEVERLTSRAVPYLENSKKDNGMVIIQKNNGDPYPYLAICGQQGYVAQKIQNKLIDYPNGQIIVLAETPNAIVHYNWLRERGCIVSNPDRVRHFKLGENYTHQRLIELQDA